MTSTYAFISDAIQWGNVPSWAACIAATIAALLAYGAYRREQRRDHVNAEIRLREQANKITAWWDPDADAGYWVVIKNASNLPTDDVTVVASRPRGEGGSSRPRPRSALRMIGDFIGSVTVAVIPPEESRRVQIHVKGEFGVVAWDDIELTLTFRDAQGIQWRRSRGELVANEDETQPAWYNVFRNDPRSGVKVAIGCLLVLAGSVGVVAETISRSQN